MFGISSTELMIIVIFGFLLFGPDKLPQMGRTIGRALRQFRETQEKMTSMVQSEVIDPMAAAAQAPVKPKKAASVDDDSDSDVLDDAAEPRRKETFAERRARLAAEKAEKEAASSASDAAEAADLGTADATSEADEVADAAPAADQEAEPEVRTTEDLYARRPRKRKSAEVVEAAAEMDADAPEGGEQ